MQEERVMKYRHLVMFKFNNDAPVAELVAAFDLMAKETLAELVDDYERGVQSSPEGLNKGLTHCFTLTFSSAAARDCYLPHETHQVVAGNSS